MLNIAGITVGAAFVGSIAGTLVVADILRALHNYWSATMTSTTARPGL
jgi:hypothetical protein